MLRDLFSLFPACAGVIPLENIKKRIIAAFPRMCGGDPDLLVGRQLAGFLFPACAGVILLCAFTPLSKSTFPRMCGGDPEAEQAPIKPSDFSPHVRG